jgi:predicted DNA-binding protein
VKDADTKMYSFRLYIDEMERLADVARAERTTVSEMVRQLIRRRIADKKKR